MVKICTRFQTGSKTIPYGAEHTYIAYIGEYSPGIDIDSFLYKPCFLCAANERKHPQIL